MAKCRLMASHLFLVATFMATLCWAPLVHAAATGRAQGNHERQSSYQQYRTEPVVTRVNLSDPNVNQLLTEDEIRSISRAQMQHVQKLQSPGGATSVQDNGEDELE